MTEQFFAFLKTFDDSLWAYLGFPAILMTGLFLSLQTNFVQIRKFPYIIKTFIKFLIYKDHSLRGIHPLKAFFACVGGCVGLGNVVGICTAVQIGGPGALFWIWVTAIMGMLVKYSEVYLGIKYRVPNHKGGYNGGPMYFLQRVFKATWVPKFVCLLLCVYGVEVYQFKVVTTSLSHNLNINEYFVVAGVLALVIYCCSGGIQRVGTISSIIIPIFVAIYVSMGFWLLIQNITSLPSVFQMVISSAFSEQAAIGGFAGSSLMLTISQGIRRGCYTGDVGIGYASVIHSESAAQSPKKQASLVIFDIFLDTIVVCTTSLMMILVTDVWKQPISSGMMVQTALSQYFPLMHIFMPIFIFMVGISTINAYFCVGLKCAEFLSPTKGRQLFYCYAVSGLLFFSFVDTSQAQIFMSITGGMLLLINLHAIFRLRHEIDFNFAEDEMETEAATTLPII